MSDMIANYSPEDIFIADKAGIGFFPSCFPCIHFSWNRLCWLILVNLMQISIPEKRNSLIEKMPP